jgi:hypothetical protein
MSDRSATAWHAPPDLLARFATASASLDDVTASSIEEHLLSCATCRAEVARTVVAVEPDVLVDSWAAVVDVIDRPRASVVERFLRRLGLGSAAARLVAATAELRWAWLVTTFGLTAVALGLALRSDSDSPFLVIAPLIPLVAVLLGFSPVAEPGGEAGTAAPLHGAGLVARRIVAVLVPALVVVGARSLLAAEHLAAAPLWLLPGLALAFTTLALSTYVRVTLAATLATLGWVAAVLAVVARNRGVDLGDTQLFRSPGQVVAALVAATALAVVTARRDRFSTLEVAW